MGNTVNYALPYPGVNDAPDGPYAVQALAEGADAAIKAQAADKLARIPYKLQAGTGTLSVGAANTFVSSIQNFGTTFDVPPVVFVTFATNAAKASVMSAYSPTTTNFTVKMQTGDGTTYGSSFTLAFNWIAVQQSAP